MAKEKITRKLLENLLAFASETAGTRFFIAWGSQKGRISVLDGNVGHPVTPELSKERLLYWIEGFHEGARVSKHNHSNRVAPIHG